MTPCRHCDNGLTECVSFDCLSSPHIAECAECGGTGLQPEDAA